MLVLVQLEVNWYDCFKKAIVKPLLKKSSLDPCVDKKFRPVSNICYISKLLERVVAEQLLKHLKQNSYLDKFLSAYRDGFSTETDLLKVLIDTLVNINSGNLVLLVLLDLKGYTTPKSRSCFCLHFRPKIVSILVEGRSLLGSKCNIVCTFPLGNAPFWIQRVISLVPK